MQKQFRVVDLRSDLIDPDERVVEATSPEAAATAVLGLDVVRSGSKRDLVARVYWRLPDQPTNMVRLYRRVGEPSALATRVLVDFLAERLKAFGYFDLGGCGGPPAYGNPIARFLHCRTDDVKRRELLNGVCSMA